MAAAPGDEYRARLDLRRALHESLTALDARFSAARLVTFGAAAVLAVLAWLGSISFAWLIVPALVFAVLIQRHDDVIRRRDAAARAAGFYERGLARIGDGWIGTGEPGDRFRDDHHLYTNDLDLFGRGSLFELLSIARTRSGEETLAAWLKQPASPAEIRSRQQAIDELTPALDLREELALAGADVGASVDTEALVAWARQPPLLRGRWLRQVAWALTSAALLSAGWWAISGDPAAFLFVVLLEVLFSVPQRKRIQRALHAAEGPARDLDVLAHVLARLEAAPLTTPRLAALRSRLGEGGLQASAAIRRLHRLVELHDWQHNQFFAPIAAAMLWGTHLGWAIEGWRARHGAHVELWLRTVGEFEALSSLSAYRYEHPDDVWPEVLEPGGHGVFDGTSLGHPLLAAAKMIRNDVRLTADTRLLVISGSNMSGKSTLLRTVGVNTVLALAGAPVRGSALRLTPLVCGATLRIQDSLQEGRSRFYAEITRIRELTDLSRGSTPLLFLLDELFHGTNSHDRLVGASAVLRTLLDNGAIGLITTHDLALTAVADDLSPRAVNGHFDDRFEGGTMYFDYRLKPGPVTRSNAIALMRAVGLDVTPE